MNSVFSEQILADKLSKLNSTQQCIETLSHWCIFHQTKAELVVATWHKQFHSSEMVRKVPLLYLANDILQNSKRKGNEFVIEFWKVLPSALKEISSKGDDRGKSVVSRLVKIWEERRVFGSHSRSLKDIMLGEDTLPDLEFSKKRSRAVKIVKRDSRSIKTKLPIGGAAEKIVSAFHVVDRKRSYEEAEMSNCKSVISRVRKMDNDVDISCRNGKDPKRTTLAKELEEEDKLLKQCIEKLKSVEASRAALVSELKEALNDQESQLEVVRTQMQVAEAQVEEVNVMIKRLKDEDYVPKATTATSVEVDANGNKAGQTPKRSAADIAAEVAEKLAASSSSQMIMHSVLSTFAAEAANTTAMKVSTPSTSFASSVPISSVKSENSLAMMPNPTVFMSAQPLSTPTNHTYQSVLLPQPTMQNQVPSSQPQYHMLQNPSPHQYMQPTGGIDAPYGYGSLQPGPPPPPPTYMMNPGVPLPPQQLSQMTQHQVPITQQQPITLNQQAAAGPPGFRPLQPPGMVYYGHPSRSQ
ncbi:Regulation of nuclear pre-mRNA domain-containing protein 1B [Linum perenne]